MITIQLNPNELQFFVEAIREKTERLINQMVAEEPKVPTTLTVAAPYAPWGFTKDGTPKKRPGRPSKKARKA